MSLAYHGQSLQGALGLLQPQVQPQVQPLVQPLVNPQPGGQLNRLNRLLIAEVKQNHNLLGIRGNADTLGNW